MHIRSIKILLILLLLAVTLEHTLANKIDQLKTARGVNRFLKKAYKDGPTYKYLTRTLEDTAHYGKNKFFKADLDHNGLTDLIVNGLYFFVLTDHGNGHYEGHMIDGGFSHDRHMLTNIITGEKVSLLLIKAHDYKENRSDATAKTDSLLLMFNEFMEYNAHPDNFKIHEINFKALGCPEGACTTMDMSIYEDRCVVYNGLENVPMEGRFKSVIDIIAYNRIVQTINYMKLRALQADYRVSWSDDQTVILQIKFDNGEIKTINDYGAKGTFGLNNLYGQLFDLAKKLAWEKNP